jgi:hypothetical protein
LGADLIVDAALVYIALIDAHALNLGARAKAENMAKP